MRAVRGGPAARGAGKPRRRFVLPPEHQFQIAVADFLNLALPADAWWSSIDHAAAHNGLVAGIRKRRGVKAGIADILILFRGRVFWIELKRPEVVGKRAKAGRHDEAQQDFERDVVAAGAFYALCRSIEEVAAYLRAHGIIAFGTSDVSGLSVARR